MSVGALARRGFGDAARAARLLTEAGLDPVAHEPVVDAISRSADPDLALLGLGRIVERSEEAADLRTALLDDADLRDRLIRVLGASRALADHLVRHPGDWRELRGADAARLPDAEELRAGLLHVVGADPNSPAPTADLSAFDVAEVTHALRLAYRRRVLRLAGRDLTGVQDLKEVATELADLAAAVLEGSLAVARARFPKDAARCRLAVIGMGKCGGRELNYVSDVDVVFVAEPADGFSDEHAALEAATRLAAAMMEIPRQTDAEGTLWEVDAALRPDGRNGPLVRPLAGHVAYYERWAKTWEFQALLKARPIAGDAELGAAYARAISPMVWQAAGRPNFVEDVQAMRRRVESHIPHTEVDRQLKLGRGGLRDIEFAVQLLQLVHGRGDDSLRSGNTLEALEALSRGGYVGRQDAAGMADSYRFLRRVEHLLQLHRLRRTHLLPDSRTESGQQELRRLGRSLGFTANPVTDLAATWRRRAGEVRRLHEKLFYQPLLKAVARLPEDEARLSPEQARTRLEALGFLDPAGALRHLEALTSGVTRRAAIQRTLLPVMLGWFADSPAPDAGLLGFRQVSDALGTTPWYLRLLRDDIRVAERMAYLLGTSRYVTDLLLRAPEAVALLADDADLAQRRDAELIAEANAALRRHDTAENQVAGVRALRRRELLRTAAADLLGVTDIDGVGDALTAIASVTIDAALRAATERVAHQRGAEPCTRMCVIAMGRFGGNELSYTSDADVMYVHDPLPGADPAEAAATAGAIVRELARLLELPAAEPPVRLDAALRPEGKSGPMVRTFDSYAAYYTRWASSWESQALLRAMPVAGDAGLGERFTALIDPIRYPEGGPSDQALREIRRLKARMEAERLPRGADPTLHTKLGRGGLSDVEWTVQLLQLRHAHAVPELRTTGTLQALNAAVRGGLLDPDDGATLEVAWRLASRVRGAVTLVRGRGGDSIPTDLRERTAIAGALGYRADDSEAGPGELMVEEYRRATRRARAVMERVFYDS
ncbi:bifunctional [glutamine synthetase] adenylyltransferase/[glutamine synthetase]-adenylyl-L-tyrosine phosphorylase [Thermobifida halotolerans]|uniref:Bifunctional glutamine synthetase adenylyltransferase/adenylyl-removing enzyme n=1 Tax=Thermobifida halotolerans TaxID=483545 RepID=A0A399G376_9ACTN|nr:bifunctional [glutamine synthetase] adenylyltransferase/[glutamine synthetase]-adenylyl-L-tyrosine phosphorylase [Thermobifida halotolerans]UOE20103.1 bifunctional [glutamine synthetase] adenylyltransferase/[glutamine synthetase]-adenylyl-L-tyrosine phosphorylase [Thermobifida halotolerans]